MSQNRTLQVYRRVIHRFSAEYLGSKGHALDSDPRLGGRTYDQWVNDKSEQIRTTSLRPSPVESLESLNQGLGLSSGE